MRDGARVGVLGGIRAGALGGTIDAFFSIGFFAVRWFKLAKIIYATKNTFDNDYHFNKIGEYSIDNSGN